MNSPERPVTDTLNVRVHHHTSKAGVAAGAAAVNCRPLPTGEPGVELRLEATVRGTQDLRLLLPPADAQLLARKILNALAESREPR